MQRHEDPHDEVLPNKSAGQYIPYDLQVAEPTSPFRETSRSLVRGGLRKNLFYRFDSAQWVVARNMFLQQSA